MQRTISARGRSSCNFSGLLGAGGVVPALFGIHGVGAGSLGSWEEQLDLILEAFSRGAVSRVSWRSLFGAAKGFLGSFVFWGSALLAGLGFRFHWKVTKDLIRPPSLRGFLVSGRGWWITVQERGGGG
jgi:hypothetical protein